MHGVIDLAEMDEILKKYRYDPSNIIAILQDTQAKYRYLPKEAFSYLSAKLGLSTAKIYSVATFYENFSLEPKGKHVIKICDGTACHVRKSIPILERLREELGLSETKVTTEDLMFTVETVSCLGACGLAPVLTVNDKVYAAMTPDKASELLAKLKEEN
ncbi:respiratory-chain nadh dehydrogenase 24 kd subunit signature [Lucifera butyrica]|uniref:Respiratory-chain nadh dehydrogenase 24 kd subunit signature n=1 Tax=Lucifera butyrica TaxID=1351585 RepID=A0A498R8X3_9FIRM|nr:NAD(P)H-dependent oxidoreductase subunit E [Lucifera butyrica]VBB06722.1 respiratory-chain nadh dehydrogenase 24 kd subunit signature [Lucifera butyrica]